MYSTIFFRKLQEMTVESRLRSLWSSNLYALPERLQALLLPKYLYKDTVKTDCIVCDEIHTWHAASDLYIAKAVMLSAEDCLGLS